MTTYQECDILFFSRGRGKGHAMPDLAITSELRRFRPNVRITFASYAAGAEVLTNAGESLIQLDLPEANDFLQTVVCAGALLRKLRPALVVSHEEPAVLTAAKVFGHRTAFLTHWFCSPRDLNMHALQHADEIEFMEREGLFPEPEMVKGRVRYVGPVLRRFQYRPEDRKRARRELGFLDEEAVILVLPGNPSESSEPVCDLIRDAFDLLDRPAKRLRWVAGKDYQEIAPRIGTLPGIEVVPVDWQLDRLMVASDVAITKATYNIGRELTVLGIPSISLSHGTNPIDDLYARSFPGTAFLWAQETTPQTLVGHLEAALKSRLSTPDYAMLDGAGAKAVASSLVRLL